MNAIPMHLPFLLNRLQYHLRLSYVAEHSLACPLIQHVKEHLLINLLSLDLGLMQPDLVNVPNLRFIQS